MATTDTSKPTPPELSDMDTDSSDDETSSAPAPEPPKIEWLATTRTKRSTAGNRMKSMLASEERAAEDDDLELLFAEDEDDAGFTDDAKDDGSDVHMDSSSDDEDQDGDADDLEGEKELERQAREKKTAQRKRNAQEAIPAKFRKKVRIEQPATATTSASPRSTAPPPSRPAPRPKKKSERMSWIPTAADMPTRASDRQTTRISKQQLHQKLVDDEVRRKKQVERMEKNAKRLEALKKPPMTQEERLREAALVEKRNSKSLNRWEVAEKQREEERLRKIAALNNRKLDGPVVTFWSGIQELEEGQLKHVGKMVSIEEKAPRKKRQSAAAILAAKELEAQAAKPEEGSKPPSPTAAVDPKLGSAQSGDGKAAGAMPGEAVPPVKPEATEAGGLSVPISAASDQGAQSSASNPETQTQPISTATSPPPQPGPATMSAPAVNRAPPVSPIPAAAPQGLSAPPQFGPPISSAVQLPVQPPMVPPSIASPPMVSPPIGPPEAKALAAPVLAAPVLAPPSGVLSAPTIGQMPMMGSFTPPGAKSNCLAPPNTSHSPSPLSLPPTALHPNPTPIPKVNIPAAVSSSSPSPNTSSAPPSHPAKKPLKPTQGKAAPPPKPPATPQEPPPEPPREGKVTKSAIILQNFDETAIKDKQVQTQILFGRKMNKLAKPAHPPLCVITNHPARYRDPKTGLPYYNSYAFKEIQRVYRGDYKFSRLLGAYVGSGTFAARGVPERFLDPTKPRTTPKEKPVTEPARVEAVFVPKEGVVSPAKPKGEGAPGAVPPVVGNPNPVQASPVSSQPVNQNHPVVGARLLPVEDVKMEGDSAPELFPGAAPTPAPAPAPAPVAAAPATPAPVLTEQAPTA